VGWERLELPSERVTTSAQSSSIPIKNPIITDRVSTIIMKKITFKFFHGMPLSG